LSEELAKAYNMPVGLYVTYIDEASGAYINGLRKGDVITAIDGVTLTDLLAYNNIMDTRSAGDKIALKVYRDANIYDKQAGEYIELTVTLMDGNQYR
jgi:serine protease Do